MSLDVEHALKTKVRPDRPFHNFRASKSVDLHISGGSEMAERFVLFYHPASCLCGIKSAQHGGGEVTNALLGPE